MVGRRRARRDGIEGRSDRCGRETGREYGRARIEEKRDLGVGGRREEEGV